MGETKKGYALARSFGRGGEKCQELGIMICSNDTGLVGEKHFQFAPHRIEAYFGGEVMRVLLLGGIDVDRSVQVDLLCHFV